MSVNQVSMGVGLSALSTGPKILISFSEMREFLSSLNDEISSFNEYSNNVAKLSDSSFNLSGHYYTEMLSDLQLVGSNISKYYDEYLQFLNELVTTMTNFITEFEELNQPK